MDPAGLFGLPDHLKKLSEHGDPLEVLEETVDFEYFRGWLVDGLGYGDGSKGGRPPFDPVSMFKVLILRAQHGLSFEQTERLVRDRLSWMRFCGLSIADPMPDANTLWDFREALIAAGAFETLFERLDQAVKDSGFIPMDGQIIDARLVAAPWQRNTEDEKAAIKAGKIAGEVWPDEPAKAAQKDIDARWTVKSSNGKLKADGTVQSDLNIPAFGYKTHISIDVAHGFIRRQKVTGTAAHGGARLREGLVDLTNTASGVWADTAYRSAANEHFLADRAAGSAASTARSPKVNRCRSGRRRRTQENPRSAPASSTSLPIKKTEWGFSSAASA